MKNKHAYLIMAHNEFYVLEKLLRLIDDIRNDIYIHIDKKCNDITKDMINNVVQKSNIYFLEPNMDVKWGGSTQVECELKLIELALMNYQYKYYHLLSGVDLPIKNQDYIHDFFKKNEKKEFIGFNNFDKERKKIKYFYFFQELAPRKVKGIGFGVKFNNFLHILLRVLDRAIILIQKLIGIDRLKNFKGIVCRGSNWVSITNNLANDIVKNKEEILNQYKWTAYPDEIFIQTYAYNSKFKKNIYNINDEYDGCLRHIDWKRGWPYTYTSEDLNELLSSNKLFARKFNSNVDKNIIDELYKIVMYSDNKLKINR